jgi:protein-S-isoprenylcysteine O-methyltransferase Ste14
MATNDVILLSLFALLSAGLIYISRSSLRPPLTHGFPRFIAWEAILALSLLNVQSWFRDPFSINQIISWLFLVISLVLIVYGVWTLRVIGKPDSSRDGKALLGIEKTTTLVTTGVYHYIRHPFYSSLLFLAWGIFLKSLSWPGIILAIVASACLVLTAIIEEREDIIFFGPAYRAYIKSTKKFIPFLY